MQELPKNNFALMRNADGEYIIGHGPFIESEECSGDGVEFYVNDFSLSEQKPWKRPSKVERFSSLPRLDSSRILVEWEEPVIDKFAQVFEEVSNLFDEDFMIE